MKKIFLIETISTFRHRYAIEADNAETAINIFHNSEDKIEEMSQLHVGELITDTKKISKAQYLTLFDSDNDYLRPWNEDQKLRFINTVDNK